MRETAYERHERQKREKEAIRKKQRLEHLKSSQPWLFNPKEPEPYKMFKREKATLKQLPKEKPRKKWTYYKAPVDPYNRQERVASTKQMLPTSKPTRPIMGSHIQRGGVPNYPTPGGLDFEELKRRTAEIITGKTQEARPKTGIQEPLMVYEFDTEATTRGVARRDANNRISLDSKMARIKPEMVSLKNRLTNLTSGMAGTSLYKEQLKHMKSDFNSLLGMAKHLDGCMNGKGNLSDLSELGEMSDSVENGITNLIKRIKVFILKVKENNAENTQEGESDAYRRPLIKQVDVNYGLPLTKQEVYIPTPQITKDEDQFLNDAGDIDTDEDLDPTADDMSGLYDEPEDVVPTFGSFDDKVFSSFKKAEKMGDSGFDGDDIDED